LVVIDPELDFCYLTTVGRISGLPRTIEIWFASAGGPGPGKIYLLSGGGDDSHWVKNLQREPRVGVQVGEGTFPGTARALDRRTKEDARARRLLAAKYQGWKPGRALSGWARTSLAVAIDLEL
jgi:deazaflavin-dependent oxidoreductase (nitroreductase family)